MLQYLTIAPSEIDMPPKTFLLLSAASLTVLPSAVFAQTAFPPAVASAADSGGVDSQTSIVVTGQRLGGEHMSAGAARCQDDGAYRHHTASRKPACSRVSDSSMPRQIAIASAEEPP